MHRFETDPPSSVERLTNSALVSNRHEVRLKLLRRCIADVCMQSFTAEGVVQQSQCSMQLS